MDLNKPTYDELQAKIVTLNEENAYLRHLTLEMETDGIQLNSMLYQLMLNSLPFVAWMKDTTGRFISTNKLFELKNNKSSSEIISLTDYDFSQLDIAKEYVDEDNYVIKNKKDIIVLRETTEDGKLEYLETYKTPVLNNNGDVIATFGFTRNVTEQKTSELRLKQSEEKFRTITEELPIGIYRTNFDGDFLHVNKSFAKILGFDDVDDLIRENAFKFYSQKSERKHNLEHLNDSHVNTEINQIIRKDGTKVWIKDTAKLVIDRLNNKNYIDGFIEIVGNLRNINFLEFLDNSYNGICIFNKNIFEYANQSFCDALNITNDEIISDNFNTSRIIDNASIEILERKFEESKSGKSLTELLTISIKYDVSDSISLEIISFENEMSGGFKALGLIRI